MDGASAERRYPRSPTGTTRSTIPWVIDGRPILVPDGQNSLCTRAHERRTSSVSVCIYTLHIGAIYSDHDFAALFPVRGQPAASPWRLALVCVLQFMEGLSDRQAAEAVRGRIDWKYALGLELTDPGFDFSVLSEFRDRVLAGGAEHLLLEALLRLCVTRGWVRERGAQRTDSTQILAAVRTLNRIETVGETLRMALNAVAAAAPGWLQQAHSAHQGAATCAPGSAVRPRDRCRQGQSPDPQHPPAAWRR
jgi:transposase